MNRKLKVKYLIAIYLIVAMLSIGLWIIGFYQNGKNVSVINDTILSLSTELLGVVLIFFIVNYFFSLEEWDLSEKVDKLLGKFESRRIVNPSEFFVKPPDLNPLFEDAIEIDICGVALGTTIDSNLKLLRDRTRAGAKVRILLIKNSDQALNISAERSEGNDRAYYEKKWETSIHNLEYLIANSSKTHNPDYFGTIEVGLLPYPPSFGIKTFKSQNNSICIVELYPHHVGWGEPPFFEINKETDGKWFTYFQEQFEAMWEISEKYVPEVKEK